MTVEGLWCAVLERAFLDACGDLSGLSGHVSQMQRDAYVRGAQEFLQTQDWIYDITGVSKEALLARLKDCRELSNETR